MTKTNINITGEVKNSIIGSTLKAKEFILSKKHDTKKKEKYETLLFQLIDKSIRMMERKYTKRIEDIYNDDFTDWLRDKGFQVSDQTRSGKSLKTAGELDIMIRKKNGTPVSIIEAFRLSSCGENNTVISQHVNKLLTDYDTAGLKVKFILIYAESKNYSDLWEKYISYITNIQIKKGFENKNKLLSFSDTGNEFSKVTDVRVGKAIHEREGKKINVFHIFINMYIK